MIENNIIVHNYAVQGGGGMAFGHSSLGMATNNTIYGNWGVRGGGFYCYDGSTPHISNSIFWNNCADTLDEICISGGSAIFGYCDIRGGFPGTGNIDSNPLFADTTTGDFRLTWANFPIEDSTKSPCIDTGDPASPPDSDGTRADMGALPFDRRTLGMADDHNVPAHSNLYPNYPNPFNAQTMIRFSLPEAGPVTLDIFDILGRKIGTAFSGYLPAGEHSIMWDAGGISSGIYFHRLSADGRALSGKMTLLK
ncbi:MAG: hypothetical protein A2W25_13650 [candidate division Zixibacteria bacterium RBG_16_53_22]|nr:MAG: hypothetical protein A2W25_13650 [candidate division Zixibacteria bacterium RBG_16_53_22]